MSNVSASTQADLVTRRDEREPVYWMALSPFDAEELAAGRITDTVQSMATWLTEPIDVLLTRTAAQREPRTKKRT